MAQGPACRLAGWQDEERLHACRSRGRYAGAGQVRQDHFRGAGSCGTYGTCVEASLGNEQLGQLGPYAVKVVCRPGTPKHSAGKRRRAGRQRWASHIADIDGRCRCCLHG